MDNMKNSGSTPLYIASQEGHLEVVKGVVSLKAFFMNLREKPLKL